MIDPKEEWLSVCELTDSNDLQFTKEYLEATKTLGGEARKLASKLVTHWTKDFGNLLDYFGPEEVEKDWYSGIDGESMDVCEDTPAIWEYQELAFDGLDAEWYRDVLRAKLVSVRIPKRLINDYIKAYNKNKRSH
jgi:hypothetical protein